MYRPAGLSDDSEDEWDCNYKQTTENGEMNSNGISKDDLVASHPNLVNGNDVHVEKLSRTTSNESHQKENLYLEDQGSLHGTSPYSSLISIPSMQRRTGRAGLPMEEFRMAAMQGNCTLIEKILAEGMPVDQLLKSGWTALMFACSSGKPAVVNLLLQNEANPNVHKELFTPLMAACASCQNCVNELLSCIISLLEKDAKIDSAERHRMTALMFASKEGRLNIVKKLVEVGADVNLKDNKGWSSLSWACHNGHGLVVNYLLGTPADPCSINNCGQKPGDVATAAGFSEIANLVEKAAIKYFNKELEEGAAELESKAIIDEQYDSSRPSRETSRSSSKASVSSCSQMEMILNGLELSNLVPLFQDHGVNLEVFLRLSDEDFEKLDIKELGIRQKLLRAIQDIHKQNWQKSSLQNPSSLKYITLSDAVSMIKNVNQHIRFIQATVGYLRDHLEASPRALQLGQSQHSVQSLSDKCGDTLKSVIGLGEEIKFLKGHLDQLTDSVEYSHADFIVHDKIRRNKWKRTLLASLVSATILVTGVYFTKPKLFYNLFSFVPHAGNNVIVTLR